MEPRRRAGHHYGHDGQLSARHRGRGFRRDSDPLQERRHRHGGGHGLHLPEKPGGNALRFRRDRHGGHRRPRGQPRGDLELRKARRAGRRSGKACRDRPEGRLRQRPQRALPQFPHGGGYAHRTACQRHGGHQGHEDHPCGLQVAENRPAGQIRRP